MVALAGGGWFCSKLRGQTGGGGRGEGGTGPGAHYGLVHAKAPYTKVIWPLFPIKSSQIISAACQLMSQITHVTTLQAISHGIIRDQRLARSKLYAWLWAKTTWGAVERLQEFHFPSRRHWMDIGHSHYGKPSYKIN